MEPIVFNLHHPEDISLPASVLDTSLSLSEIGALVALVSLTVKGGPGYLEKRLAAPGANEELSEASERLKSSGVLQFKSEGKTLRAIIDLEAVSGKEEEDKT